MIMLQQHRSSSQKTTIRVWVGYCGRVKLKGSGSETGWGRQSGRRILWRSSGEPCVYATSNEPAPKFIHPLYELTEGGGKREISSFYVQAAVTDWSSAEYEPSLKLLFSTSQGSNPKRHTLPLDVQCCIAGGRKKNPCLRCGLWRVNRQQPEPNADCQGDKITS